MKSSPGVLFSYIVYDLGRTVADGTVLSMRLDRENGAGNIANYTVYQSANGSSFTNGVLFSISSSTADYSYTLNGDADYLVFFNSNSSNNCDLYIDAVAYSYQAVVCTGGTAIPNGDTDGDGIKDVYDLDNDNDGIPDIVEAGVLIWMGMVE
jgi:hypothetical protein